MEDYNGWTNRETWAVALWIDNEEPLYRARRRMVAQAMLRARDEYDNDMADYPIPKGAISREDHQRHVLEDTLREWVGGMSPDLGANLWADLLSYSLAKVNWRELAEHWMAEE